MQPVVIATAVALPRATRTVHRLWYYELRRKFPTAVHRTSTAVQLKLDQSLHVRVDQSQGGTPHGGARGCSRGRKKVFAPPSTVNFRNSSSEGLLEFGPRGAARVGRGGDRGGRGGSSRASTSNNVELRIATSIGSSRPRPILYSVRSRRSSVNLRLVRPNKSRHSSSEN